ncbi:MAG TPA: 4Fe-4S binding protein [Candidatus Omnitrophota bacterium]|nr:4Fe-4S binding protein [Candidatus Omnitrophota bacterium]
MKRNIIRIDEDKCTGCGDCITDCPEGALKIINGKAKLVKESLCDGMGMCVGKCPTGALTIEVREADAFDEAEAQKNMNAAQSKKEVHHHGGGGCPGSMMQQWNRQSTQPTVSVSGGSALRQWPVQLHLLNPSAPYFQNADLVVAADCVPFSYPNFHERFLKNKVLVIFCPKLDNSRDAYIEKLTDILKENNIRSVTTVHMEVPCCGGTVSYIEEAIRNSGKNVILKDYVISIRGEII